jgi:hypothetical protein
MGRSPWRIETAGGHRRPPEKEAKTGLTISSISPPGRYLKQGQAVQKLYSDEK